MRTCKLCNTPFAHHTSQRYCSDKCKKEALAAYQRHWRATHRKHDRKWRNAYQKQYYIDHPDKRPHKYAAVRKQAKEYYEKHKEHILAKHKKWYKRNRDKILASRRIKHAIRMAAKRIAKQIKEII
jgi:hypothetical protein